MAEIVHSFSKNSREEVRAQITEYRDGPMIDIRVWYLSLEEMEYKPSKKGLTLKVGLFPALKEAILKLEGVLTKAELIGKEE